MKRVLSIEDNLPPGEELDLSDDRPSCRLFWSALLDYASSQNAEEVRYNISDGDDCISFVIDGSSCPLNPLPTESREMFLRFAQEIALGQFWYTILVRMGRRSFDRIVDGPLLVEVGPRRSKWHMQCTRDSIRFWPALKPPSE